MSIEAPVPSNKRMAPSEISTGSLNVNVMCVGAGVEHLARLRVTRQQLGVSRDAEPTPANVATTNPAAHAHTATRPEPAHGSPVTGSR